MRSWMKKLCLHPELAHGPHSTWQTNVVPVSTTDDSWGYVWSVATDGKRMLALCDGGRQAKRAGRHGPALPLTGRLRESVAGFLTADRYESYPASLGDLRLWLGPRQVEICTDCGGSGCEDCLDRGWSDPEKPRQCVRLWAGGPVFCPQLLGYAFPKALGTGPAVVGPMRMRAKRDVYMAAQIPLVADGVTGDGTAWRAVAMPLQPEVRDDDRTAPTYVPGIGSLWHLRDGPRRGILADWCQDQGLDVDEVDPANRYVGLSSVRV